MAKFLDTDGLSFYLKQLINDAQDKLILISPYLKFNELLKDSIKDKDRFKIDIRIIYGKNELQSSELNWLKSLNSIRTSFCKELHAWCYLNEKEAIITSMNLFDYSQRNNYEMGVYIEKAQDAELYKNVYDEVQRLIRSSQEVKISVPNVTNSIDRQEEGSKPLTVSSGFCIRCHSEIILNPLVPYCKACNDFWQIVKDENMEEYYCHICGKSTKSSLKKPACDDCQKSHKDNPEFPAVSG